MTRRMLLTSNGLTTPSLVSQLELLLHASCADSNVCYFPTAALAERENDWIVGAMKSAFDIGWGRFEIADLRTTPRALLNEMMAEADVLFFDGGNTYALAYALWDTGMFDVLRLAIEEKVYVGASAGSMIFSKFLNAESASVFGESEELSHIPSMHTLGWFEWYFKPHFLSGEFSPRRDEQWAKDRAVRCNFPVVFVGDDSAVIVNGGTVETFGPSILTTGVLAP